MFAERIPIFRDENILSATSALMLSKNVTLPNEKLAKELTGAGGVVVERRQRRKGENFSHE